MIYVGCDAHKRYSMFATMNEHGMVGPPVRVDHDRTLFKNFLNNLPLGSPIAVETVGSWYWMIDEMEKAGHKPVLVHARKAKLMMGQINKTDSLDAKGLALLLRNGTLPKVWIPPAELRDQRELPRMRMALVRMRTMLKSRIHSTLAKYGIHIEEASDIFGTSGREILKKRLPELPPQTQRSMEGELAVLDEIDDQIDVCEQQIKEIIAETPAMKLLMTLPGVGPILGVVIAMEIGDVERFGTADRLASYAGTVPRVSSSGGKTYLGKVRPDVNRYLKWAFVEAANVISVHRRRWPDRHVVRLYRRIWERKGHAKAVVAVARHLAEASYWILNKNEPYREPESHNPTSSIREEARRPHELKTR
jgi:transposase